MLYLEPRERIRAGAGDYSKQTVSKKKTNYTAPLFTLNFNYLLIYNWLNN
jgi:hypothetical protein